MTTDISELLRRELNDEQHAAALDTAREVLTLACAGSGKSRTLAYRIVRLLAEGNDPRSIVAFTFTEKAAESIKRRVSQALRLAGMEPTILGAMYIGTIHSYCQHLLGDMDARYRQFEVLDENKLKLYLISRYPQLGLQSLRRRARQNSYFDTIKQVSEAWKTLHDELITIGDVAAHDPELGQTLQRLEAGLEQDQFIDFSLMIRKVVDTLVEGDTDAVNAVSSLQHLMVDEYQDVNPCQEELIRQMHARSETLFVVGDDDQSIYAWRGADVTNILNFERRYPQCSSYTLGVNFRSTAAIVQTSDFFVSGALGAMRRSKNPRASDNKSPRDFRVLWFTSREDEARWVAGRIRDLLGTTYEEGSCNIRGLTPADFLILMRSTRTQEQDGSTRHSAYTRALDELGIHYTLEAGGGPFERPQVQILRETFELLRRDSPSREVAGTHFRTRVLPSYPHADFDAFVRVMTDWGRLIHTPLSGTRRRVYPQQLVHDLLACFRVNLSNFPPEVMRDIGLFSRMLQDVESVYMSVDSATRFAEVLNFLSNPAETGYDVSTDDVLQRPDAVTVSTVHKAKGLEFPVVFVVDVESQRFPGRRRSYEGWLPQAVIQAALARGAYQGTPDEEARLFYTAITRAERYLHVTGAENLPGGKKGRRPSEYANRLAHDEISTSPDELPAGLSESPPRRRIDETVVPTSFSAIKYYLKCPKDYQFRQVFGFSPPIPEMFGFGKTVHTSIEKLHERFTTRPPTPDEAEEVTKQIFHLKHVPQSGDPESRPGAYERAKEKAGQIAREYVETYREDFVQQREVEARFEIPAQDTVISGSIDLLLKEDGQGRILEAHVIDFKALEGGSEPADNNNLDWTELALQVQLYAKAAQDVLGENARTGSVHLLKDNQRIQIPVTDEAMQAAVSNVEWAVQGILANDFPMRPHPEKCLNCDFIKLCSKIPERFRDDSPVPVPLHLPGEGVTRFVRAFSEFSEQPIRV